MRVKLLTKMVNGRKKSKCIGFATVEEKSDFEVLIGNVHVLDGWKLRIVEADKK